MHPWLGRLRVGALTFLGTLPLSNCVLDDGGLNQNERTPGNGDEGVSVGFGEIAVDPTGKYLLSSSEGHLVYGDLSTGSTRRLPRLDGTTRVAFDHTGSSLFATRISGELDGRFELDDNELDAELELLLEAGRLVRYEVDTGRERWALQVPMQAAWGNAGLATYPFLEVTSDDSRLVLTYRDHVELLDAASGDRLQQTGELETDIVDVDLTPDQLHLVITLAHTWRGESPSTLLQMRDLATFSLREIEVPNCADELAITPDGKHALLAPTTCQPAPDVNKDPVSVIDLSTGSFVRNLPGFGPVALAPDGSLAIAFMDAENIDPSLFDDQSQIPSDEVRFHLMLIDTATLTFDSIRLGDALPRYALSPDGQLLLVDAPTLWDDGRVRVLDVKNKQLTKVTGPSLRLDHYVMTRDSKQVFLLDHGLFRIALAERAATAEPIDFTPTHLNITPDDRTLVLREDASTLWLYDTATGQVRGSMRLSR